jgi:hypothetical protein
MIIRLQNIQTNINELTRIIEENDESILFNEKYLYSVAQNNNKKLSEYAETLKRINEGQIDVSRGQGESEQDYFKRLSDVALIEEDLTIIHLFNSNELKKNLKPIVNSEWKIENISKEFDDDSKFLLNKTFAGFKKFFKDKYGIGNKNLDVDEYVSIIRNYLDQVDLTNFKKPPVDDPSSSGESFNYDDYLNRRRNEDDEESYKLLDDNDNCDLKSNSDDNIIDLNKLSGDDDEGSSSKPPPKEPQGSSSIDDDPMVNYYLIGKFLL